MIMVKNILLTVGGILFSTNIAHAALFICGNETTFNGHTNADLSNPPQHCPAGSTLHSITDAAIATQQLGVIESMPKRYLKVVAGVVIEKAPEEKTAVDQAIAAEEAEKQAYADLANNNDLCNATKEVLTQKKADLLAALRADIAGITNVATTKTELDDMMVKIVNGMGKLIDCLRGRAGKPN